MEKPSLEYEQANIVVDETARSAIVLDFDADQKVRPAINLLHFKSFDSDLAQLKRKSKETIWEIKPKDEEALKEAYNRIVTAKHLNVEQAVKTESLKQDHKNAPNILAKIDSLINKGYKNIRRCRGDGNCYYRAVYYAYFETLICKGPKLFRTFVDMLKNHAHNGFSSIKADSMFKILISICEQIYERLVVGGAKKALQYLFQSVLLVPEFDLAMVQFLRELLYHFLLSNKSKELSGLKLEEAVIGDAESLEEYCEKIVRKMGEEAQSLMLPILPLILRIKIYTVVLDTKAKAQGNDVYIEACEAQMEDYESPFDPALDFKKDSITLLLKPGHYDILYKTGGALEDPYYDKGFEELTKLIFKNKEKEKEEQYAQNMKDKIKVDCCKVFFEKEEYMKALIQSNAQSEYSLKYYPTTITWIKCICGTLLDKRDLSKYFSSEEITYLLAQIQDARKGPLLEESNSPKGKAHCILCKKVVEDDKEYRCSCGKKAHVKCAIPFQKDPICQKCAKPMKVVDNYTFKTPCCGEKVDSKEYYIADFIELNNKKKREESISPERMICPLCSKIVTRFDMEKGLSLKEIEAILGGIFNKACAECKAIFNEDEQYITSDCGHYYHIFCAKFISDDTSYLKKCRAKGCNATMMNLDQKIKQYYEMLAKNCVSCRKRGTKFIILDCNHYVCYACGEDFRKGMKDCFEYGVTSANALCSICDKKRRMQKIYLQCKHVQSVDDMRGQLKKIKRGALDVEFPACYDCLCGVNDVEIYALIGRVEGAELLNKIENTLKMQKEVYKDRKKSNEEFKRKMEEAAYSPKHPVEPTPKKSEIYNDGKKSSEEVKRRTGESAYMPRHTIEPSSSPAINPPVETPASKTEYQIDNAFELACCEYCSRLKPGLHRFMCMHKFCCKGCIKGKLLPKIETGGVALACKRCNAGTNLAFTDYVRTLGNKNVNERIQNWRQNYIRASNCCVGYLLVKTNEKTWQCSKCHNSWIHK